MARCATWIEPQQTTVSHVFESSLGMSSDCTIDMYEMRVQVLLADAVMYILWDGLQHIDRRYVSFVWSSTTRAAEEPSSR